MAAAPAPAPARAQSAPAAPAPQQVAAIVGQRAAAAGKPLPPEILKEITKQAKSGAPPEALQGLQAVKAAQQRPSGVAPGMGAVPPQGQIPPALLQAMMAHAGGGMPPQGMPPGAVPARPPMAAPPQGMPPPGAMPRPAMPPQGQAPLQPRITPPSQNVSQGQSPISVPPAPGSVPPNPGIIPFARAATSAPPQSNSRLTPSETAMLGRGGDSIVAHLSPGEISIPKELQTPQLIAAIQQVAAQHGISPAQLVAGSQKVSRNPATGLEEHSFLSSILPALAMGATAFFAPELLPMIGMEGGSVLGTAALVGGVGAGATALTGGNLDQSLLTGAIGAVTGGMGAGNAAAAANAGNDAAINAALQNAASQYSGGAADLAQSAADAGINAPSLAAPSLTGNTVAKGALGGLSNLFSNMNGQQQAALLSGGGGALAGILGQGLATPPPNTALNNFNSMTPTKLPVNPNFGQLLGSNQAITPTFQNYSPYQAVTGVNPSTGQPGQAGFNFFPQQNNLVTALQS